MLLPGPTRYWMSWDGFLNEIFKVVELLQLLGKVMFSFDIRK